MPYLKKNQKECKSRRTDLFQKTSECFNNIPHIEFSGRIVYGSDLGKRWPFQFDRKEIN